MSWTYRSHLTMKRLTQVNGLAMITLVCPLACLAGPAGPETGICYPLNSTLETLNFGVNLSNGGLTIAPDTPVGTVVYQDTLPGSEHTWGCWQGSFFGVLINPVYGTAAYGASIFALGKTGLSYRIWVDAYSAYETSPYLVIPGPKITQPASNYRLEIIKSGPLAAQVKVDAGLLGSLQADVNMTLKHFNLAKPIVLTLPSCQTPSVAVKMGDDYQLHEFSNPGPNPRAVRFAIALNQCQAGIKKVTYSLKAAGTAIDTQKGIVALNAASTAKGIGLQVMNEAGKPIALDTTYPFAGFTTTGTSFKIPLSATYYRVGTGELKAGSANTEVTFVVNYL